MFGRGREFDSSFLRTKQPEFDELNSEVKGYRLGEEAQDVTLSPDYAKIAEEQRAKSEPVQVLKRSLPLIVSDVLKKLVNK